MDPSFRTCSHCGARNKPQWEFCARCGEPLEIEQSELETEGLDDEAPPAFEDDEVGEPEPSGGRNPLRDLLVAAALVVAAVVSWQWLQTPSASAAPTAGFVTVPTVPPAPAGASQTVETAPGEDDLAEGRTLLARGQAAEAAAALARAVEARPEDANVRLLYAQALMASGAVDEGLAQYDGAIRLAPERLELAVDRARAIKRAGRTDDAIAAYEGALAAHPGNPTAVRELAELYVKSGRADRAAALLGPAAERTGDLVVEQQLGRALEASGKTAEAQAVYRGILEKMPQAHLTRGLLAETLFKQGQRDEAIAVFREGLQRDASAALLYRGLGSLLERTGQTAEAATAYREFARLAPAAPDAAKLQERADKLERKIASQ